MNPVIVRLNTTRIQLYYVFVLTEDMYQKAVILRGKIPRVTPHTSIGIVLPFLIFKI